MAPVAAYLNARLNVADLIALLVALIPTTIGALLSAIGIAGIDRTVRFNVLAMSGKAVEAAGDVHTLILDKTGTITLGNRQATEFIRARNRQREGTRRGGLSCLLFRYDPGRTNDRHLRRAARRKAAMRCLDRARRLDFSAETRMSGLDLARRAALSAKGR